MTVDKALDALGLTIPNEQRRQLTLYRDLLLEKNQRLNLTGVRDIEGADSRLIAESIAIRPLLPWNSGKLLDVGSGGGVPGIPLAIIMPQFQVDLLDATSKKVEALRSICVQLGLRNTRVILGRAEELGHNPQMRGGYTVVTARAVARLATLVEYTLPFLEPDGMAILPKGESVIDEVSEAEQAMKTLGGRLTDVFRSPVNGARFVIIEQDRPSPSEYPRRTGIPSREPIGVPAR